MRFPDVVVTLLIVQHTSSRLELMGTLLDCDFDWRQGDFPHRPAILSFFVVALSFYFVSFRRSDLVFVF